MVRFACEDSEKLFTLDRELPASFVLSIFQVFSFYCHSKFLAQVHFLRLLSTELFQNLLNRLWVEVYLLYNFFIKAFGTRLISFIVTLPFSRNFHCLFFTSSWFILIMVKALEPFQDIRCSPSGIFQLPDEILLPPASGCSALIKFFGRQLSQSFNSQFQSVQRLISHVDIVKH